MTPASKPTILQPPLKAFALLLWVAALMLPACAEQPRRTVSPTQAAAEVAEEADDAGPYIPADELPGDEGSRKRAPQEKGPAAPPDKSMPAKP